MSQTADFVGSQLRPALFLDRDGVINEDAGYVFQPADIHFIPGIFSLVGAANAAGMPVVVVTNQSGIGRGYFQEQDFHALMGWMRHAFAVRNCRLDGVYFCPHHPVCGVGGYKIACTCRKPAPGMLLEAAREHGIDLRRSVMVGDSLRDLAAAEAAGVETRILFAPKSASVPSEAPEAASNPSVRIVATLTEALEFIPSPHASDSRADQ